MGQYYKGEKIGTCDNMYYLRLDEARELARWNLCDDDGISFNEYLSDNVTRFRFEWPEEDKTTQTANRDPFKTFKILCHELVEIGHKEICVHHTHIDKGYGINIFLPCPDSKEANYNTSNNHNYKGFLLVEFQAIRDGNEKTIFKCARCGQSQYFSDDEIKLIKERATEYYNLYNKEKTKSMYEYAMKVIERIK